MAKFEAPEVPFGAPKARHRRYLRSTRRDGSRSPLSTTAWRRPQARYATSRKRQLPTHPPPVRPAFGNSCFLPFGLTYDIQNKDQKGAGQHPAAPPASRPPYASRRGAGQRPKVRLRKRPGPPDTAAHRPLLVTVRTPPNGPLADAPGPHHAPSAQGKPWGRPPTPPGYQHEAPVGGGRPGGLAAATMRLFCAAVNATGIWRKLWRLCYSKLSTETPQGRCGVQNQARRQIPAACGPKAALLRIWRPALWRDRERA